MRARPLIANGSDDILAVDVHHHPDVIGRDQNTPAVNLGAADKATAQDPAFGLKAIKVGVVDQHPSRPAVYEVDIDDAPAPRKD